MAAILKTPFKNTYFHATIFIQMIQVSPYLVPKAQLAMNQHWLKKRLSHKPLPEPTMTMFTDASVNMYLLDGWLLTINILISILLTLTNKSW